MNIIGRFACTLYWFSIVVIALPVNSIAFGEQVVPASERSSIEEQWLSKRLEWRTGQVLMKSRVNVSTGPRAGEVVEKEWLIRFDEGNIQAENLQRTDMLVELDDGTQEVDDTTTVATFTDDALLLYGVGETTAQIRKPSGGVSRAFVVPDPRKAGVVPADSQAYHYQSLDFLLGNPMWSKVIDEADEKVGEVRCRHWVYDNNDDGDAKPTEMHVWFAPEMKNQVVAIEYRAKRYKVRVESVLEQVNEGPWLPATVLFWRWNQGELARRETLTLRFDSINEAIDPEVFTLAGMGVPQDTEIRDFRGDDVVFYRMEGQTPVPISQEEAGKNHTPVPIDGAEEGSRSVLLAVNVAAIVALIAFILYRRFRPA
ncbi:MAG: hypothetical protein AAF663_03070 [Planctomycetota bacterium]